MSINNIFNNSFNALKSFSLHERMNFFIAGNESPPSQKLISGSDQGPTRTVDDDVSLNVYFIRNEK